MWFSRPGHGRYLADLRGEDSAPPLTGGTAHPCREFSVSQPALPDTRLHSHHVPSARALLIWELGRGGAFSKRVSCLRDRSKWLKAWLLTFLLAYCLNWQLRHPAALLSPAQLLITKKEMDNRGGLQREDFLGNSILPFPLCRKIRSFEWFRDLEPGYSQLRRHLRDTVIGLFMSEWLTWSLCDLRAQLGQRQG